MAVKRRTVIYILLALLAISIVVICFAFREAKDEVSGEKHTVNTGKLCNKTILIDPGHGGFDAGASANGIEEKGINLAVALKLRDIINQNGGRALLTRECDVSTADENRASGSSAKISDLQRRRAMTEEVGANIFISIHMNKFEQSRYWGAQVFYAEKSEASKLLGETVQEALARVMNDGNKRKAKDSDGSIFVLKNANVPSILVECGFLSNKDEAEKLASDGYQQKLAQSIFEGICDYTDKTENR